MNMVDTVPSGHGTDVERFTFGNLPGLVNYSSAVTSTVGGFSLDSDSFLLTASFPNLTQTDPGHVQGGGVIFDNNPNLTSVSCPALTAVGGNVLIANNPSLTSISFPLLATIFHDTSPGTPLALAVAGNASLTTISFPSLVSCQGQVEFSQAVANPSCPLLTTINSNLIGPSFAGTTLDFPSLVTVNGNVTFGFSANLVTWNAPNWVPQPGFQISFNSCPNLSAASVNQILARCVANASFTGASSQVTLDGAAPTGQGITDKATLIGRGCTVVTN